MSAINRFIVAVLVQTSGKDGQTKTLQPFPQYILPKQRAEMYSAVQDAHNYFRGGLLYLHMQYA